jgi:class 3 adenylate cyclase/tetratricopeptide (TPR) repeat protein
MKCPKCRFENPKDAKFCNECGNKLEHACPQCGKTNPLGSNFCNECGRRLREEFREQRPSLECEGERKCVTVLFSDLAGYTAMSENLDPEDTKEIISRIFGEIAQVVTKYGGFIEKFIGDAVMAVFGIPKVHEDDPVRAVKAAREIHQVVEALSPKLEEKIGVPLSMHSGVNTGLVVTGEAAFEKGELGISGDTINLASRLQGLAKPGEILVGPQTHDLVCPYFEMLPLNKTKVKGKSQPMIPYRVVRELTVRTPFEAAEKRGFTAFIGRNQELNTLYNCFEKTLAANGQFVTIVGEAGVGKSRLAYEFRHSLDRNKVNILQGRCQSFGSNIPYLPLLNALRRGLHLNEEDTPAELHEKTVSNVLAIDQKLEKYLPLYLHLLSIPSKQYSIPKHLEGEELKTAIHDSLAAINILNSKQKPMVLILEDWHWVDEASNSALKHIVSVMAQHSLMVVVIYRPDYTSNWEHLSNYTPIVLKTLDNKQCENILKSIWGAEQVPSELNLVLHDSTGGNPFFIEELCEELVEQCAIEIQDRRAVMTRPIEHLNIPSSVQSVIRARMDRLDSYAKESLRLASVIGREFVKRILERVSTSKDRLAESLETLKAFELIQQVQIVPEAAYMFKHVLTQEVAYEGILRKKRKELHRLVGQAIEEIYSDRIEEQVELLHHHFNLAEDRPKAAAYGRQAAIKAYRLSQFQHAITLFEQAKSSLLKLPENQQRKEELINLHMEMFWASLFLGRVVKMKQTCQDALSIAKSLKSSVLMGKVSLHYGLYYFHINQHEKAEEYYLQGLDHVEGAGNERLETVTKFTLAVNYFSLARWEDGAALYFDLINTLEKESAQTDYFGVSYLPYTHCCTHLGYILALQGQIEKAGEFVRRGYGPDLEQVANLQSRLWCAVWHSAFSTLIGMDCGALKRAHKALELAKKTDSPLLTFLAYAALGNALYANERIEAAIESYEQALQIIKDTDHQRYLEAVYYNLVRSNILLGNLHRAEKYYQQGLYLEKLNPKREKPRFDFLRGWLVSSEPNPDFDQAEEYFYKSINSDQRAGAVVLAAQTRFYLAKMLAKRNETKRSIFLLNELSTKFEDWHIPFWQEKCKEALALLI